MFERCLLKGPHAKVGIANNAIAISSVNPSNVLTTMSPGPWSQCMVSCRSPCRKSHCDGPTICHSNVYWQTAPTSFRQAQHQWPPVSWPCYMTQLLLLSIPAIAWQSKCGTQSATLLGKHSGHLALHHRRYVYVKVPSICHSYVFCQSPCHSYVYWQSPRWSQHKSSRQLTSVSVPMCSQLS